MKSDKYYAIRFGKEKGIYTNWGDCQKQVQNIPFSSLKLCSSRKEAEAFIENEKTTLLSDQNILSCLNNSKTHPNMIIPSNKSDLEIIHPNTLHVYTDGSCHGNGTRYAIAGIGIYFGENDLRNKCARVIGEKQTNNIAELEAISQTLDIILNDINILPNTQIIIHTDSIYAIRCVTTYGTKVLQKKNCTNIPNIDLIKKTIKQVQLFSNRKLKFQHIKAHTNLNDIHSKGNAAADALANQAVIEN